MIANDFPIPMRLASSGIVTSLSHDNYFKPFERYSNISLMSKSLENYLEPVAITSSSSQKPEFSLSEQNYDINLALQLSPNIHISTMQHPHNIYEYRMKNNNVSTRNYNKRGNWKSQINNNNHAIAPHGYESDESNNSHSSRKTSIECESTKHKIPRNGYRYPYESTTVYTNYRCNNNSLYNTVPSTTHQNSNGSNKRYHSNNGKRLRRDYKHNYSDEIVRRVHGLMERFTSKTRLFEIGALSYNLKDSKMPQLDQVIWDLFTARAQTEITYLHKLELWRKVYLHIMRLFERYALFMVGSTMSGLGTENSDIDMCLLLRINSNDPRTEAVHCLEVIRSSLESCDFVKSPEVIHAKVPILKFKCAQYGFEVDLNCNNAVGIRNTHLLHCYTQMDWRVRPLVVIVKLWAQANCINNAKNMTISSYSLALMVIHYLQCGVVPPVVPCLHGLYQDKFNPEKEIHEIDIQEELPAFCSDNNKTLGELFIGFLEYYANFKYETYAISVRLAARVPVDECRYARSHKNDPHQWKYLCIEEPFDLTNTARSVYDLPTFKRIHKVFQDSHSILKKTGNLSCILTKSNESQR